MRKFVDEEIVPEAKVHELNGKPPSDALIKKMGSLHMLAMRLGPGKHLVSRHSVMLRLYSSPHRISLIFAVLDRRC